MQTFWGILIPFLGTALGAACVFFIIALYRKYLPASASSACHTG